VIYNLLVQVCVCNVFNIETIYRLEKYFILNKRGRKAKNYELSRSRAVAMTSSVILGNPILARLLIGS